MFEKGQKVVCIATANSVKQKVWFFTISYKRKAPGPKEGKIYTISEYCFNDPHKCYVVELNEFPGEVFVANLFAPIDELFAEGVL